MMGMAALAIIPSYATIAQTFKASNTMVQMLTSLPNLTMMLAGLAIGQLTRGRVANKTIAVGAILLIVSGGLLPLLFHTSMTILLIFSALVGFGQGLTTNLVQVLITNELPENQRQTTMGQSTTFTNIGGMIFMSGGGWLSTHYWVDNYWIYAFAAVILIIIIVTLPNDAPSPTSSTGAQLQTSRTALSPYVWLVTLLTFFSMMLNNVLNNNISLFIANHHFGSTAVAGYASTVGLLGGMLCGLLVGSLARWFPNHTIMLSFTLCALAFLIIGLGNSLIAAFIGAFLNGAAFSISMAQSPYLISIVTTRNTVAIAIGFYTAFYSVGGVISPIVMNPLAKIAGDSSNFNIFTLTGIMALAIAVIVWLSGFQRHLRQSASTFI